AREQPLLLALASGIRRVFPDRLAAVAATPAPDASRAGEPRRRAVGGGDRLAADADRRPGRERSGGADGDSLRAALERARCGVPQRQARPDRGAAGMRVRLSARGGPPAELLVTNVHTLDPRAGLDGPHDLL